MTKLREIGRGKSRFGIIILVSVDISGGRAGSQGGVITTTTTQPITLPLYACARGKNVMH